MGIVFLSDFPCKVRVNTPVPAVFERKCVSWRVAFGSVAAGLALQPQALPVRPRPSLCVLHFHQVGWQHGDNQ